VLKDKKKHIFFIFLKKVVTYFRIRKLVEVTKKEKRKRNDFMGIRRNHGTS
jgi:hypothetical protein